MSERLKIMRVQNEFERSPNMLIVGDSLLSREECDLIIHGFHELPYVDCWFGDEIPPQFNPDGDPAKVCPKDRTVMEKSWKCKHPDGKEFVNLHNDHIFFKRCMEFVDPFLPKNDDYQGVNYAQIIRYPKDTLFQYHQDVADGNDTATAIFFLNEEYKGGRLTVEGTTIGNVKRGTMVTFNNSTTRWHGVEPIYDGERYVFAIWFGKYDVTEEGADDESENSEVQPVSDGVES